MLAELGRSELGLWAAFYKLDPWGEQRADYRAAIGHALLANINRDKQQHSQPFAIDDFLPYPDSARARKDPAREVARSLVNALQSIASGAKLDKRALSARRRQVGKKARPKS